MKIIFLAIMGLSSPATSWADLSRVNRGSQDHHSSDVRITSKKKTQKPRKSFVQSPVSKKEVELINAEADIKNAQVVSAYLNSKNLGITDNTKTFDVVSGTTMKGIILNSIVSSNLESPILVQVTVSNCDIPINTKLLCSGTTRGKRVGTVCSKLITDSDEFEINASLLNIDGTSGLTGTVFTGKEELVVGTLAGGALSAALDVSRDRISTATGELATNSQRNRVITGAMGGLDEAVSLMGEESKNKETKITIEAGREVLIFINQRFKI